MKVLIAEDESFLLDMYKLKFAQEGYEVATAMDGAECVAKAKAEHPDLILLDLVMPHVDGYAALTQLKADPNLKDIPVIIFSNLGQKEEIDRGVKLGAMGFIVKANHTPSSVAGEVAKVIGKSGATAATTTAPKHSFTHRPVKEVPTEGAAHVSILLIEDDAQINDIYTKKFTSMGWQVTSTANGAWGLKEAESQTFTMIVLDIVMPAMHGIDALKGIRASEANNKTPIIVLTNSAQDEQIKEARAAGANEYYIKALITPSDVVNAMRKYMPTP